jgi:tryptophan 2,3-dioxygenase
MSDHQAALTYSSYLGLDDILGAQRPRTEEHDELLFIVIHQVYELWFKQLLHEGKHLQTRLEDGDTPHALHTLKRMLTILKTVVAQIDVLETMTPRQFLTFRDRLEAASGFQSAQFRELEASDDVQHALLTAYADDGEPAQVCERMIDLDEGIMEWRYRHMQMVRRTIGDKRGTGGSPGAAYLATTLLRPAFPDLWAVRTEL